MRATTAVLLGLLACSGGDIVPEIDPDTGPDGLAALTIESVDPDSGPDVGGTSVRVVGTGFTWDTTSVAIGGSACDQFTFLGETGVACIAPAGPAGAAELVVSRSDDGATATAAWTWTSTGDDTGTSGSDDTGTSSDDTGSGDDTALNRFDDTGGASPISPVDYCHLQHPCEMTGAAGGTSEAVYCWVYHDGATPGVGQGAGVSVQLGYGPDDSDPAESGWSWSEASYNTDKDGLHPGDLSNDEYQGALALPSAAGDYDYACRVSADGEASWTHCDRGDDNAGGCGAGSVGSGDGYDPAEAGQLVVE